MTEFLSDTFSTLPWLKNYQVPGCPENVIKVWFRWPPFRTEHVLVRINALEEKIFRCTVVRQPEKDWRINKGDKILVEYYYFAKEYRLVCRTIEEKFGFKWLE
jgi:hypothetical protein